MTRVVVIGGSGHVGSYLVPRLVERGYEVTNVSRGTAKPYLPHSAWKKVKTVIIDRKAEEAKGTFAQQIIDLKPDIVIDMIAFQLSQVQHLVPALEGKIQHYIFCSTIWVYGHSTVVPALESDLTHPVGDYGVWKRGIELNLMEKARKDGFPATSFRPGHIVGRGWNPLNPQGNFNPDVFNTIAVGEKLCIPDHGLATVHHVHADDCASWVVAAIDNRGATIGECFNTVSSQAMTLRGYAEAMYRWFGHEPKLEFKPLEEWNKTVGETEAKASWEHIKHSPCASVEKSRKMIGWEPRYSSLEGIQQAVEELIKNGKVVVKAAE